MSILNKVNIRSIAIYLLVILLDLAIYLFLGLLLVEYEDFYTAEQGPFYSLQSMTIKQKCAWIGYQGWIILNVIGVFYLAIKRWRKSRKTDS